MTKKPTHYLISLSLGRTVMHGYLMSDDKRSLGNAIDQMMSVLEKGGIEPPLPIWLSTELGDAADEVRQIIRARSPEAKALLDTASDYHFTAWAMEAEDPDCQRLMELH